MSPWYFPLRYIKSLLPSSSQSPPGSGSGSSLLPAIGQPAGSSEPQTCSLLIRAARRESAEGRGERGVQCGGSRRSASVTSSSESRSGDDRRRLCWTLTGLTHRLRLRRLSSLSMSSSSANLHNKRLPCKSLFSAQSYLISTARCFL